MNRLQWKETRVDPTSPGDGPLRYHARSSSVRIYVCEPLWARALLEPRGTAQADDDWSTSTRWRLIATWLTPIEGEVVPGEEVSIHATLQAAKRAANRARAERG